MRTRSILLLPAAALLLAGCWDMPQCGDRELRRIESPDRARTAILFERSCGGTTPDSAQVSIIAKGGAEPASGNAFVASGGDTGTPPSPWVEMKWLGADRLLIRHDARANLYDRRQRVGPVAISYEAVRRQAPWPIIPPRAARPEGEVPSAGRAPRRGRAKPPASAG